MSCNPCNPCNKSSTNRTCANLYPAITIRLINGVPIFVITVVNSGSQTSGNYTIFLTVFGTTVSGNFSPIPPGGSFTVTTTFTIFPVVATVTVTSSVANCDGSLSRTVVETFNSAPTS